MLLLLNLAAYYIIPVVLSWSLYIFGPKPRSRRIYEAIQLMSKVEYVHNSSYDSNWDVRNPENKFTSQQEKPSQNYNVVMLAFSI